MKKVILTLAIGLLGTISFAQSHRGGAVKVRGYVKSDGTVVKEHWRSAPDNSFTNNWSTVGNYNPYTGKEGTKTHPSSTSSSSINYYNTDLNFNSSNSFNNYDFEKRITPSSFSTVDFEQKEFRTIGNNSFNSFNSSQKTTTKRFK
jgi:hypothetical protein